MLVTGNRQLVIKDEVLLLCHDRDFVRKLGLQILPFQAAHGGVVVRVVVHVVVFVVNMVVPRFNRVTDQCQGKCRPPLLPVSLRTFWGS